jgi:hypothetical protein
MSIYVFGVGLFLFGGTCFVFSQTENSEANSFPESAIRAARQMYTNLFVEQMQLYNGVKYNEALRNPESDRGHRFFISETLTEGTIQHNDIEYNNIPLLYDNITDQVITVLPNTNYKVALTKHQIQSFTLLGHHFVNLADEGIIPGFYELLLDDSVKVVAKRSKKITESNYDYNLIVRKNYIPKNEWYIFRNNRYFLIGNKKSLVLIFADQEQKINSFIRQMKTSFRKDKEKYIVQVASYYNSLN